MSDKIHAEVWINCECGQKIGGTIIYPEFDFTCLSRSISGVICGMTHKGEIKIVITGDDEL